MAWKGQSRRHSLARKGIKTAKGINEDHVDVQPKEFISVRQDMIKQADRYKLPEGYMAITDEFKPRVKIINMKNNKSTLVSLFAYSDVVKALYELSGDDEL